MISVTAKIFSIHFHTIQSSTTKEFWLWIKSSVRVC